MALASSDIQINSTERSTVFFTVKVGTIRWQMVLSGVTQVLTMGKCSPVSKHMGCDIRNVMNQREPYIEHQETHTMGSDSLPLAQSVLFHAPSTYGILF
jgi:hypothetical protein